MKPDQLEKVNKPIYRAYQSLQIFKNNKELSIEVGFESGKHFVWISKEDGEGAEFSLEKFYECINKFYKDNFQEAL